MSTAAHPRARSAPAGSIHNADVAAVFNEIADLLEIGDENPFRIRAYRNAARVVESLPGEAAAMVASGADLTELPGVGEDLAGKISDIVKTGSTPLLAKLRKQYPRVLPELLRLPGLGPKRVKMLYDELDIETLPQLHRALKDGRVGALPGFGDKIQAGLLEALAARAAAPPERMKLATAAQYAEPLAAFLRKSPDVRDVVIAGSYRRARETVGDIDIIATSPRAAAVIGKFVRYPEVRKVIEQGATRASVILRCGLQVDLRVVPPESYGAAVVYFTGSKAHNLAIRRIALTRHLKINEYGVFRGAKRLAGETEDSVYRSIGLPFIPPELREDRGEIEAARTETLPKLVELADIRGDLHAHTTATDGRDSLRDMALAAKGLGHEYIAITDHSRRVTVAHGLDAARLERQIAEIDRLNRTNLGIRILKGIEVDILDNGALDLPDRVLAKLDIVIGAVHSKFDLTRAEQTGRIVRAFDNPYLTMLAHPTGRLMGERDAYDVDMARVIRKAAETGKFLELNAHPERLDLIDTHCRMAKEAGVLVSINTDAHSVAELSNLRFGVGQARRGWLAKNDVVNTCSLKSLERLLQAARVR
jgi:DNA polymerase (family X)